jgi:hypothetical protein
MSTWMILTLLGLGSAAAGAVYWAGRRAGVAAETARQAAIKAQEAKEVIDAQKRIQDAGANAPADRVDLDRRLRDGSF